METIRIRLKNPPKPTRYKFLARPTAAMDRVINFLSKLVDAEMKKPNPDKELCYKIMDLEAVCALMSLQQKHDAELLKELGIKAKLLDDLQLKPSKAS